MKSESEVLEDTSDHGDLQQGKGQRQEGEPLPGDDTEPRATCLLSSAIR